MQLDPKNLEVQMFGDIAIATFNLYDRPGTINRRTLVLRKESGGWKIVHLHASEITRPN
jgi:ketosteroid isomerase-like protein